MEAKVDSRSYLTRYVCRSVGWGSSAATGLCPRNTSHWPLGIGHPAQFPRRRRGHHGIFSRSQSSPAECRLSYVVVCRRIWCVHDRFRTLPQCSALPIGVVAHRRFRYGQRSDPRHSGAACHTGRNARTSDCRGHDFYWNIERIGPVRIRPDGPLVWDRSCRRVGRNWYIVRHWPLGLDISTIASGRRNGRRKGATLTHPHGYKAASILCRGTEGAWFTSLREKLAAGHRFTEVGSVYWVFSFCCA